MYKCCCGQGFDDIDLEHVAVAKALWTSALRMLLWLRFGVVSNPIHCEDVQQLIQGIQQRVNTLQKHHICLNYINCS